MRTIISVTSKKETGEIIKYLQNQDPSSPLYIAGKTIVVAPDGYGGLTSLWRMTHGCNMCCKYCKTGSPLQDSKELPFSDRIKILEKISRVSDELDSTGGEVTTMPRFDDIVRIARSYGFNIRIGTNGVLVEELLATADFIDQVFVSLDHPPDFHNANRVPTTYDRIYGNIARISQRHPRVTVESVVTNENYPNHFSNPERSRFADDLTKECGIFGIRFSFLMNKGRAKGFYESLKVPAAKIHEAKELCKTYSKTHEINFSAYDGSKPFDPRLHLDPFGKITFFGKVLGNALEETPDSILGKAISLLEELYSEKARIIEM